ncbi:MAG: alpha-galactosidase [Bacteroides sp.]|nr:alpha-galactosidase [Bacteroides sp.]MCM1094864.1 alpha-galactosidase [Terasakiella sp.]
MRKTDCLLIAALAVSVPLCARAADEAGKVIRIATDATDLVLTVGDNGRLYQSYLGPKLLDEAELDKLPWIRRGSGTPVPNMGWEVYSTSGNEDYFEPALGITHADGNPSTYLYYVDSRQEPVDGGIMTTVDLRDDKYPLDVTLYYVAYPKENVIKTWTDISHREKKPVKLSQYASAMLYFDEPEYYLTEFAGDWAREAQMTGQPLRFGKKVVDTKLGSRAAWFVSPLFEVGLDGPAREDSGRVLMGTLGWTGNFRFTFEVDNMGYLRVIPGINPYASVYELNSGDTFTTPEFVFTLSDRGTGQGSRDLHDWARRYSLKDGETGRLTLLNNWENTYFRFDQPLLASLMKDARSLGVDMFLLDDGWFGNKHPRDDDHAGLGDWEPNREKLPGGIKALTDAARDAGVKFGLWIEPEMVNPRSELFEKHPEWAIRQPNRDTYYSRNQLVLDMSNPEVQDYVFGVIDGILTENPGVAYFKWDCNSPITNIYSPYLKDRQGNMYVDHVRGVYNVMERVSAKYPGVPMMLCSSGGARCDYEALKHFTEFWCSDNTDPLERVYIQWGFSHFFPAKAMASHVTSWNKSASVKFRTDVASMCRLGFDIGLQELDERELEFCRQAVANWKRLQPAIMDGTQYRLVSPYESNHAVVEYVDSDRRAGVVFAYNLAPRFRDSVRRVRLRGLDPAVRYRVAEINLMPGAKPSLAEHGATYSGDYLMKVGLDLLKADPATSTVVELTAL